MLGLKLSPYYLAAVVIIASGGIPKGMKRSFSVRADLLTQDRLR